MLFLENLYKHCHEHKVLILKLCELEIFLIKKMDRTKFLKLIF